MGRATVGAATLALAAVLALVLAGCSAHDAAEPPPPQIGDPSASTSAPSAGPGSATASPTRPPSFGQKVANQSAAVHEGTIEVTGAGRRAVADTLVAYMTARLTAYNTGQVQLAELAAVARGKALNDVQAYVQQLREQHHHTVGEVWVDVSRVKITGKQATITSCMPNATADADKSGRVVEQNPAAAYDVRATARLVARDTWVIEEIGFTGKSSCG